MGKSDVRKVSIGALLGIVFVGSIAFGPIAAAQDSADTSDKQLKAISSRCATVQSKIRTLSQTTTDVGNKRTKFYKQADGRVEVAIGKLKLADKDTGDLEKTYADFKDKVAKYQEAQAAYIKALDDLSNQDCKNDPTTFSSALGSARKQLEDIRTLNTDLRTSVTEDLKSALSNLTSGGDSGDDTSGSSE